MEHPPAQRDPVEEALRAALAADATSITPAERLAAIQDQVRMQPAAPRRATRWLSLAAAAAVVGVVGSVAAVDLWRDAHPSDPLASTTISASTPSEPPATPTTSAQTLSPSALPVYFPATNDTDMQTWLLTRTFITPAAGAATDPASRINAALTWAMRSDVVYPLADLAPPWHGMDVKQVDVADDLITITLASGGTANLWSEQAERSVIAMFVWTAQAVLGRGRVPVTFVLADGGRALFDRFPAADRYDREASDQLTGVVAPVWIDLPGIDQVLSAGKAISVRGLALAPSSPLSWQLRRAQGMTEVATGSTTADEARPQAAFAFTIDALPEGTYYLTVSAAGRAGNPQVPAWETVTLFRVR